MHHFEQNWEFCKSQPPTRYWTNSTGIVYLAILEAQFQWV